MIITLISFLFRLNEVKDYFVRFNKFEGRVYENCSANEPPLLAKKQQSIVVVHLMTPEILSYAVLTFNIIKILGIFVRKLF